MNIQEALTYGRRQLRATSPSPELDARLLLQHSLQVGHPFLVAHRDRALTGEQEQKYRRLIERAGQKEPVPYLVGQAPFYGLEFIVNPAVLIPRPETEQLVEAAVHWANVRRPWRIADIGTGSGCIAVTLALHLPQSRVDAVDISAEALAVAQQNAQRHAPGRIHFHLGHLLTPLLHQPDLITANLPYVADGEWTMLDDGVKLYEPAVALRGGPDGLDLIRQLLQQATSKLNPGGAIFLEVGWRQGPAAQHLAQTYFPTAQIDLMADYAGHDRIVAIKCG